LHLPGAVRQAPNDCFFVYRQIVKNELHFRTFGSLNSRQGNNGIDQARTAEAASEHSEPSMTGMQYHRPVGEPGQRAAGTEREAGFSPRSVFKASAANLCLCHCLVIALLPSPAALGFAIAFAETGGPWLRAHYHYLRTTIALLVIGLSSGSLMILAGLSLSSKLMLAGLGLCAGTMLLVLVRSLNGIIRAFFGLQLRNHRSYFI
jgi:hypothetical protein